MGGIQVGSEWIDDSDGDVLKILVVDGVVLRADSKNEGLCTVLANDLLRNYRPKVEKDDEAVDMVNHPPHYKDASGIECIEVTKHMSFCGGNCFKYLYRAGKKGSTVEDLKKAIWYAERAWIGNEMVCDEARDKIFDIAHFRLGNIAAAMDAVRFNEWDMVEKHIKAEIARLEGE